MARVGGGAMDVDMGRSGPLNSQDDDFGSSADAFDPSRGFSTPTSARRGRPMSELSAQRRRKHSGDGFRFTLLPDEAMSASSAGRRTPLRTPQRTPASSGSSLSTPSKLASPARYSPGKVKEAVRSFADFLHFLEQNKSESPLMPMIIQRFAELGSVIESQKRHIDHWKQKELDLAISEAHQNLGLIQELGETIQKQEVEISEWQVQKQSWEEKFRLAEQEVEALKHTGGMQIQQVRGENVELKRRAAELEAALRERENAITAMQTEHGKFTEHLGHLENEYTRLEEENQKLRRQTSEQADAVARLEGQAAVLQRQCEAERSRAVELEQAVETWKQRVEEKESHRQHLEQALDEGRREMGEREGSLSQLQGESKKYQENLDEYEQELTQMQEYMQAVEADNQALRDKLEAEGSKYEAMLREATEAAAKQTEVESGASSTIKQMEEQFMQQKAQFEAVVQQEMDQMRLEKRELVAKLQGLEGINASQAAEIHRMAENLREAEQQFGKQGRDAELMKRQHHDVLVQLRSLEDANKGQSAEINRLMTNLREAEAQFHQQKTQVESERVQQLSKKLEAVHKECERLQQVIAQKETGHAESLDKQKSEYENKHSEFVARVESQFQQFKQENDQLRAALEEKQKQFQEESSQLVADKEEEITKWIAEYDKVESKLHEFDRANESLNHELDKALQELELKRKENTEMSDQIEQYLAPNSERSKEMELLHSERLRLEEQNLELQQQIQATRQEADVKLEEAHQLQLRASEQEGAHRNELRALYLEKEDMNRKLLALGSERSAIDYQLKSMASEKGMLLERVNHLEQEKRGLEARLEDLMRHATREMEAQQQQAVFASEDIRSQLQNATSQLTQREEQLRQGHQQLQSLEREVQALREKNQQLEQDARSMRSQGMQLNARLEAAIKDKAELESTLRLQSTTASLSSQRATQRAVEAEYSRKLDNLKVEANQRVTDEVASAKRVQAALESRLDAQERQFREDTEDLEQARTDLAQQVELLTHSCERLEAELEALKIDRENQEKVIQDLDQTIDMLEREKSSQHDATSGVPHVESVDRELRQMHEQFKKDAMAQLKDKADQVAELEDDNAELQAKLDRQKEMTRHLMDRAGADKQQQSGDVGGELRAYQDKSAALERQVQELKREMQVKDESRSAKDQSVMHEKLQLERELRSLQRQCDGAAKENSGIRAELERKTDEIEDMRREIQQNTAEMEIARNALAAAEQQLNHKFEEFGQDLEDREHELYNKETELQQARELTRQTQVEMSRTIDELKHKVASLQSELERAQRPRTADKTKTASQQDAEVRTLQKRCDELQKREQSLSGQVARLEDDKAAAVDRFTRELRRLNVDLGRNQSDGSHLQLDDALHEYVEEVTALMRSFEDREGRQDALIHRKEQQINELKERLAQAERGASSTPRGQSSTPRGRSTTPRRSASAAEDEMQRQMDEMNDKVAALSIENRQLRAADRSVHKRPEEREPSDATAALRELETKYSQLKARVQELKGENSRLKHNRLSKADAKTFVTEIEKLTAEVTEKDLELQALRRREAKLRASNNRTGVATGTSTDRGNGTAAGPTDSLPERSRDLRALLQLKEDKIMVLNDHLTELMKQSVRLQHENERYVVRFGALADPQHSPTTASSNTTASDSSRRATSGPRRSVRPPRAPTVST